MADAAQAARLRVCQLRFASVSSSQQGGELREPAKVAIVDTREPSPGGLADRVAVLLDDEWQVDELFGKPTVAILVAGGAQAFKLRPRVDRVFREGLVKAARMTNAFVFTGGMATGVMKRVGEALANHPDIPCIGMPLYGNVLDCEQIARRACSVDEWAWRGAAEETCEYLPCEADNAPHATALDPHHTHFVLVDNGERGTKAWGREIDFVLDVQLSFCKREG